MKQYFATIFLGLGLVQAALGGKTPLPPYVNYGVVNQAPVIDSPSFYNAGVFNANIVGSYSLTNLINLFENGYSVLPFMTKDTLYFTNTGQMLGTPGFEFDTATSTSRHSASFFLNQGTMTGFDTESLDYVVGTASGWAAVPADNQPIASQLLVYATNIVNTGSMSVGNAGILRQQGNNVTNAYASLAAGVVATVGPSAAITDVTGGQGEDDFDFFADGQFFFTPSLGVYDLFWGITNGLVFDTSGLPFELPEGIPGFIDGERGFDFPPFFPVNQETAEWNVTATFQQYGTNIYYNVVFVNTNFANGNISAAVGVSPEFLVPYVGTIPDDLEPSLENIVQFSEPVYDVITGQTVTNGVYLIDDSAILPTVALSVNSTVAGNFDRPTAFEVTTVTPFEWEGAVAQAEAYSFPYIPELMYADGFYSASMVPFATAIYGAQIGYNPADISGSFSSLADTNSLAYDALQTLAVNLPDLTNLPGRIELNAGNLDLTQTRMRAEGMAIFNATNFLGGGTGAKDWGVANATLGSTNGSLTISNVFPVSFQRVRGDIYAESATWQNTETNGVTNQWYIHVLVVDQNLFGSFPSSVRNLKLTGTNSLVLQDNLNVLDQVTISTPNLTVTATNFFSQKAQDFTPANTPGLTNLFIGPAGLFGAANYLEIGLNQSQGQASPTGRKYTVNSIVNFGQIQAAAPIMDSAYIENAGQITANDGGSMLLEAKVLSLGPALSNLTTYVDSQTNALGLVVTNSTNTLSADNDINLSAATIEASNSIITAGLTGEGSLTLEATALLTDFVSATPTTNTNSVIINHWSVTGGFSMPVKPALGDLFGTEIHTMVVSNQLADHVWAGTDMGATPAGFVNNAVIGRLVLDREAPTSWLQFSAAGAKNAMYVDYLELTNYAYSGYRTNLLIDPNFKIYFAACNGDPEKLMEIYPGLVWVQNFAGPNSTQVVPYFNSSNVCLMNSSLAQSTAISFFNGVANYYNQPYVLNNPSDPTETYPCPGDETTVRSLLVTTPTTGGGDTLNLLNITINGEGSITPDLVASELTLGSTHTLTATPARGWVFQDWSTIGLSGPVNAASRVLPFTFISNVVITANFIPNPFPALQGAYSGLFFETNAVDPGSSGAFSLTLSSSGSFSGRLLMGSSAYTFSSQFTVAGTAQFTAKSGAHSLSVNLQLDMTGQTGQIKGQVSGGSWNSDVAANVQPTWTAQNLSPLAGSSYTMVLPMQTGTAGTPGGAGFGVGSVNKQGVLNMAGTLADGAAFSVSAPVSQGGQWPFYIYSAAGKDTLLGWVSVSNGLICTNVSWSKAAGKGPLYAAGFSNVLQLVGSPWVVPAKQTPALTLANPVVLLSGGNLAQALTEPVRLENYLTYTGANLTLTVRSANGSFGGSFTSAEGGSKKTISGVVLQNQGRALGFFPGTSESGAVLLESQSQ